MSHFIAYAYPGWHRTTFRPGLNEWELLDNFVPMFRGHEPLREPLAGRYDDAEPSTAARQISEAVGHGISGFTYFTFHTGARFVLHRPARAALHASSGLPFSVAATWCLRLPHQFLPIPPSYDQKGLAVAEVGGGDFRARCGRFEGWTMQRLKETFGKSAIAATRLAGVALLCATRPVSEATPVEGVAMQRTYRLDAHGIIRFVDAWLAQFASQESYMRLGGRPVLSVLNLPDFTQVYGLESFRLILSLVRKRVAAQAGVEPYLIGLVARADAENAEVARRLPLDAVTGYGLLPEWDGPPVQQYEELIGRRTREWHQMQRQLDVPFFPVVCSGWDATVRGARVQNLTAVRGFPWRPVVVGVTPERFGAFLDAAADFNRSAGHENVVFLHAWNEWTEGAAIEPGIRFGYDLLECVRARASINRSNALL